MKEPDQTESPDNVELNMLYIDFKKLERKFFFFSLCVCQTSNGEISFSMRMDWISRRQRSPSRGFFARWSTCQRSLLM